MSRRRNSLKTWLVFFHRWLGVLCCLPFIFWFASGIVLMYHEYPSVSERDRLARAAMLDPSAIRLTPGQAYERLGETANPNGARMTMIDERPAYRFGLDRGDEIVYADNGEIQDKSESTFSRRVASDWTGQSPLAARAEELTEGDQWTVSGEFKPLEPIRKYSWPDGQQVYVSAITGDVVQYTTRTSRIGAYFGAIPHWLYFTPLRKHVRVWSRLVIWLAGLAVFTAFAGIIVGISAYSPSRCYTHAGVSSGIPYSGTKRLHMILGLSFGLIAGTWALSGMLSMDPFPRLQGSVDQTGAEMDRFLRGGPVQLAAFDGEPPQEALRRLGPGLGVKELELLSFAGEPVYIARITPNEVRIVQIDGQVAHQLDFNGIVYAVQRISQPVPVKEARIVSRYEAYYVDRHSRLPLPAIFVRLGDENGSSYYIDPKTARIVESYNFRSRWNRWLYHGLHSADLPWLYAHRPVWDVVVLTLLIGGILLAVTALLLASRVLRRSSLF